MNSTIFDFRINLEDGNILKYILDSIFIGIVSESRIVNLIENSDFSLKSQFSELKYGQTSSSFLSILDYCNENKECLVQTLYPGYYGYTFLFNLDTETFDSYTPEYLIRGSVYFGALKLRGYENWGYLSLEAFRAVRNEPYKGIITENIYRVEQKIESDSAKYSVAEFMYPEVPIALNLKNVSYYGGAETLVKFNNSTFYSIIENGIFKKVNIFAEINARFDDYLKHIIDVSILTNDTVLNNASFNFIKFIDYYIYSTSTLNGFVSNFGIILTLSANEYSDLYSAEIYFEHTQGE